MHAACLQLQGQRDAHGVPREAGRHGGAGTEAHAGRGSWQPTGSRHSVVQVQVLIRGGVHPIVAGRGDGRPCRPQSNHAGLSKHNTGTVVAIATSVTTSHRRLVWTARGATMVWDRAPTFPRPDLAVTANSKGGP